jgi:hypothetical protein
MPLYICRWQNGNVSAVSARSREDAIVLLDEIGSAEACELFPIENFMVHFRLKDKADNIEGASPLELEGFGGDTLDVLYDHVYPVYAKALVDAVEAWRTEGPVQPEKVEEVLSKLSDALSVERTRQWGTILEVSGNPEKDHLQNVGPDSQKSFTAAVMAHAQVYPQSGPPSYSTAPTFTQAPNSAGKTPPNAKTTPSE